MVIFWYLHYRYFASIATCGDVATTCPPLAWAHPQALLHSGGPLSREFRQFTIPLILHRHLTPYNWLTSGHIQLTRDVDPKLGYYWSSICDAGTALHKHWIPTFHVKTLLQHKANIGSTSRLGVLGIRPALCPDICVRCRHCSFVNLIT